MTSSGSGRLSAARHDERSRHFSEPGVRHGDDRHLGDVRMLQERGLDFGGGHIEAADDDDVLFAVDDAQVAVRSQKTDITGMQPTLRVDGLPGPFGVLEILVHHVEAPDEHLARRLDRQRGAAIVDDA